MDRRCFSSSAQTLMSNLLLRRRLGGAGGGEREKAGGILRRACYRQPLAWADQEATGGRIRIMGRRLERGGHVAREKKAGQLITAEMIIQFLLRLRLDRSPLQLDVAGPLTSREVVVVVDVASWRLRRTLTTELSAGRPPTGLSSAN